MSRYKWGVVTVVGVMLVFSLALSLHNITVTIPTVAQLDALPVIIIDPGHGGVDGGAVGFNDIVEKDINLDISLMLRDMLVIHGFDVILTRETDVSIHDEGITSTKKQKSSDLHNRLAIVQANPNAIFISIHQNKFEQSSSKGAQVFFSPNNKASEHLADIMQARFIDQLQPENTRVHKKAGKNLFLMTQATCPAVLVECGFLSNQEEAYLLTDVEYQSQVAFVVFCSIMDYLEMDLPVGASIYQVYTKT